MATSQVGILLVDDFQPFRLYISSMLQRRSDIRIVGEAADGVEAVECTARLRPELILLDIGLPRLNGIDAARQMRKASPESKIIFLTQETSIEIIEEALGTGPKGYIVKSAVSAELMSALNLVIQGGCFVGGGCGVLRPEKSRKKKDSAGCRSDEVLHF